MLYGIVGRKAREGIGGTVTRCEKASIVHASRRVSEGINVLSSGLTWLGADVDVSSAVTHLILNVEGFQYLNERHLP